MQGFLLITYDAGRRATRMHAASPQSAYRQNGAILVAPAPNSLAPYFGSRPTETARFVQGLHRREFHSLA